MPRLKLNKELQAAKKTHPTKEKDLTTLLDLIPDVTKLLRDKNNLFMTGKYRIDAKSHAGSSIEGLEETLPGVNTSYYKVDIQTVAPQKKLSVTVAVVFISETVSDADDLEAFKAAVLASADDSYTYIVS